jgi:hypothetical protein
MAAAGGGMVGSGGIADYRAVPGSARSIPGSPKTIPGFRGYQIFGNYLI